MNRRFSFVRACAALAALSLVVPAIRAQKVTHPDDRTFAVEPYPIDAKFRNPVDPAWEKSFFARGNVLINSYAREANGDYKARIDSRTFFESEKWSYPAAMKHILAGNVKPGLAILQAEDSDGKRWHEHTLGIDLFPAFTLKGQVRKYFFFGPLLDGAYRERMKRAVDAWTKTNPRATPHPVYQKFNPKVEGWTPERFGNLQADSRNTDNLRAMRDGAIYLFAEESGNSDTQAWAQKEIQRYATALYTVGMGEWDSETYHCHTAAAYLNIYDFAKDPQVKMQAKLALDHMFTAAAIKYRRGTWAGPSKRDYGWSYVPLGGSSAKFFALYFDNIDKNNWPKLQEHDVVHALTSNYRPPAAVIELAKKDFDAPVELLATKPTYENWKDGNSDRPESFETLFFGKSYQLGTLLSAGGNGDASGFRLVADRGANEVDLFVANSRPRMNEKFPGDQVGQYRNLVVWLRSTDKANDFTFFLPKRVALEQQDGVWFAKLDRAWLAIRPINLGSPGDVAFADAKLSEAYADSKLVSAKSGDAPLSGFALEVGEGGSFEQFKQQVLKSGKLDVDMNEGRAMLTGSDGTSFVEITHNAGSDFPTLVRNGESIDFYDPKNFALWRTVGEANLVSLGWKQGELRVNAGGKQFTGKLDPTSGAGSFSNE